MQLGMNLPLYLDWSFWTVVVAAVALILSQLPPIHQLLQRAKLTLELHSRIHLTHKIGNPNVQLHATLTNVGGRSVRVKEMVVSLRRDGHDVARLTAQGYLQESADKNAVLFTGFRLKSKEEWAHIVNLLNFFSRTDEKRYRAAELALRTDIVEKKKLPDNKERLVEADQEYLPALEKLFDEKFIWLPGEYELDISVRTTDRKANIRQKYRFVLFESDSTALSNVKADFKYGDGIYYDSGNHPGVIVQIVEA